MIVFVDSVWLPCVDIFLAEAVVRCMTAFSKIHLCDSFYIEESGASVADIDGVDRDIAGDDA